MKKLKINLTMLALILGVGTAFATAKHHRLESKTWGKDPMTGLYVDITGQAQGTDYTCTGVSGVCSAEYPEDVNPNDQANDSHPGTVQPQNIQSGAFAQ